ncbi:Hypothetical predicted protein [Pelobates cultripes]|uniref:Reverse transcriptase domain-containing protein n=1 Tax=Pelobates cultripes TaxID=61616 RepID=A0AAD1QZ83_PELCU|nr:Hypothetical predicted protein [Pelobates cultripes]
MGKSRDLFKKIGNLKVTFHAKVGVIKDKNGRDLTEEDQIKKRWQEYTEDLYRKDLNNSNSWSNEMEPDILESKVRCALGCFADNKAAGVDEIPIELFKILQDDAVKILLALRQQIWKPQQWPKYWERNLYVDQEATVRTEHGTTEWFKIGKGVRQGCILSPYLFNLYAEYVIRNAGLDESKAKINIAGRNIKNLRYADTTLMAESEEELKEGQ